MRLIEDWKEDRRGEKEEGGEQKMEEEDWKEEKIGR